MPRSAHFELTVPSSIALVIDRVIRADGGLASWMKAQAFKKHSRTFVRSVGPISQIVNVQASQGNFAEAGKFTINLAIHHLGLAEVRGNPTRGAYPKEYECLLRERIGKLMPQQLDHWWQVRAEEDVATLAIEVRDTYVRYGEPWLQLHAEEPTLLSALRAQGGSDAVAAAVYAGDLNRARELARALLQDWPRATAVHAWLRRLGLIV